MQHASAAQAVTFGCECAQNMELVGKVKAMAEAKGVTAGQLALAWVHAQGDDVFPIPGGWSAARCNSYNASAMAQSSFAANR